jgi:hypothetical protein
MTRLHIDAAAVIARLETATFVLDVVADPVALRSAAQTKDSRPLEAIIADEVVSNLESVDGIDSVEVRVVSRGRSRA